MIAGLSSFADEFALIRIVHKACTYVIKGLKFFSLKKFTESYKYFEKTVQLVLELPHGEQAPPEAARSSLLLCRLQMYACLHINNFFMDKWCHLYVVGLEFAALYNQYANSEHVLVCLEDEFDPLPSLACPPTPT